MMVVLQNAKSLIFGRLPLLGGCYPSTSHVTARQLMPIAKNVEIERVQDHADF